MEDISVYFEDIQGLAIVYAQKVIMSIIVLLLGLWLIRKFLNLIEKLMLKRAVDESLIPFLKSLTNIILFIVLILTIISLLGVPTASFLAVLGSAGLAIGLALQGSLSNFAGGVLILTLKPFKKGDFIQALSTGGTVQIINLLNTVLRTPDGQIVYIPNGQLASATITNFSQDPLRRIVIEFSVGYKENIQKAKSIIEETVANDERVVKDPLPSIVVSNLADSAVIIAMRVWTKQEDYWNTNFELRERIKVRFDQEGISIPFPQRDIHIYQHAAK